MDDKRRTSRRRTLKDGKIVFADGMRLVDCTIRNMADGGAQIVISGTIGLPDGFYLFEKSSGLVHRAELKWRKATVAGLALSDPVSIFGTSDKRFARLKFV